MTAMHTFLAQEPLLAVMLRRRTKYTHIRWGSYESAQGKDDERQVTEDLGRAEAVSSELSAWPGDHEILLDLDVPAYLLPSSTPGHSHLYIERVVSWDQLEKLLRLLGELGVLEWGYIDASIARKATFLRLPWVKKGAEAAVVVNDPDRLEEWLTDPTSS